MAFTAIGRRELTLEIPPAELPVDAGVEVIGDRAIRPSGTRRKVNLPDREFPAFRAYHAKPTSL